MRGKESARRAGKQHFFRAKPSSMYCAPSINHRNALLAQIVDCDPDGRKDERKNDRASGDHNKIRKNLKHIIPLFEKDDAAACHDDKNDCNRHKTNHIGSINEKIISAARLRHFFRLRQEGQSRSVWERTFQKTVWRKIKTRIGFGRRRTLEENSTRASRERGTERNGTESLRQKSHAEFFPSGKDFRWENPERRWGEPGSLTCMGSISCADERSSTIFSPPPAGENTAVRTVIP